MDLGSLDDLKTKKDGLTLYLVLPQRYVAIQKVYEIS
jgi:hypothetical protein